LGVWCLGFCALVKRIYRCRVHIGRRGNRACTPVAHICEQERFAANKNIQAEASLGFGAWCLGFRARLGGIATAASTRRPLTFWMLDLGLYLGFGAWGLGFRARFVASSDRKRIEKSFGVIPIA